MGEVIEFKQLSDDTQKIEIDSELTSQFCVLVNCIGELVRNNISVLSQMDKALKDKKGTAFQIKAIVKNNDDFVNQFYVMQDILVECVPENNYKNQIQIVCDKFSKNIRKIIIEYLNDLFVSKRFLKFGYILSFLSKVSLKNNLSQADNKFFINTKDISIPYNYINLEQLGMVLGIDFNNVIINEEELKQKDEKGIIEFLDFITSQGLIINEKYEIIDTFDSYIEKQIHKNNAEKQKENDFQQELNKKNIEELYEVVTQNHFEFIYRFLIDENNYINLYYNKKCYAFLEEVVKDGKSSLKQINGPTFITYPTQDDNGDVANKYIDFSSDIEARILNDEKRLECIPYIRAFFTFPFGMSFSLFKEFDDNYYTLNKIREFEPNIKYLDELEKINVETYYNAVRFVTYVLNETDSLAKILGDVNSEALNNSGLESIKLKGKGTITPFAKLKSNNPVNKN